MTVNNQRLTFLFTQRLLHFCGWVEAISQQWSLSTVQLSQDPDLSPPTGYNVTFVGVKIKGLQLQIERIHPIFIFKNVDTLHCGLCQYLNCFRVMRKGLWTWTWIASFLGRGWTLPRLKLLLFLFTNISGARKYYKSTTFKIELDKKYSFCFVFFPLENYISWFFFFILQNTMIKITVYWSQFFTQKASIYTRRDRLQGSLHAPDLKTLLPSWENCQGKPTPYLACPPMFWSPFCSSTGQSRSQQSLRWWQHWDRGWRAAHCGASNPGI